MERTAVVLGATGQIGPAVVRALAEDGWRVRAVSRGGRDEAWDPQWGVRTVRADRDDDAQLRAAVGSGCDALVDVVAYTARHGRQLRSLAALVGSAVIVSTSALYTDEEGRGFGTMMGPRGFGVFPEPIDEGRPVVAPAAEGYLEQKRAMETEALRAPEAGEAPLAATLLRVGMPHGPGGLKPAEWWFAKRALDGRPVRLLAHGGDTRFHPAHIRNIAEAARLAAGSAGRRVLNIGDPEVPTARRIAEAVDEALGVTSEIVGMPGPAEGMVGFHPYGVPNPFLLDLGAAERELGYKPVTGYLESLPETVDRMLAAVRDRDWRDVFPGLAHHPAGFSFFDYEAEDRWLAAHAAR